MSNEITTTSFLQRNRLVLTMSLPKKRSFPLTQARMNLAWQTQSSLTSQQSRLELGLRLSD